MIQKNEKTKSDSSGIIKWGIPVLFVLLLVLSAVTTFSSNHWISREMTDRQLALTRATADNLSYRLAMQSTVAVNLMTKIYPYISNENSISDYVEYAEISKQVNSMDLTSYITKIYIPDNKTYSSQRDIFNPLSKIKNDSDLNEYYGNVGINWIEPVEINFGASTKNVIGCIFTMNRLDDYSTVAGSVILYYPLSSIEDTLNEISENNELLLINKEGKVLATTGKTEKIGRNFLDTVGEKESGCSIVDNRIFSFCKLNNNDWKIAVISDASVINKSSPFTIIPLLISIIMFTVLIISFFVTYNNRQMNRALLESIESSYKQKIELSNYQMQALQEQIKPHFLYNTLDIIRWMIADKNNDEAIETITALSKYLRMSISRKSSIVTIKDEVELAETYVEIIRKKSSAKFESVMDIAEDTLDLQVPRFILQPILENSLIHGILYSEKTDLELTIRTWTENSRLFIEVEDNGKGMSQEKLSGILTDNSIEPGHGYGLKNTKKRLEVFNGEDTVFEIHSKENFGTCVSIEIKAQTNEP